MTVSPSAVIMRHSDVFQVCLQHSGVRRSRTSQVRSYQHFLLKYFHTVYILYPTFSNAPFFPLRSANPWCLWLRLFICMLVLHHCLCSYEIVSFVFCMYACLPLSVQFKVAHILASRSKTLHMWHHWLQISANATASNLMGDYKQFVSWNQSNTFKSLFHCRSSRVIAVFLVTALDVLEVTNQSMKEVTDWKFYFRESPLLDRDRHEKRGGPAADGQYGSARAAVDVCWQTRDRC